MTAPRPAEEPVLDLVEFQAAVGAWCLRNFGVQSDLVLYGGTGEEAGELLRGAVKREQGIRGTRAEWDAEIRKEIGDVAIKLASIAAQEGWDLTTVIAERWADVSKRDWVTDKIGHGIPAAAPVPPQPEPSPFADFVEEALTDFASDLGAEIPDSDAGEALVTKYAREITARRPGPVSPQSTEEATHAEP